MLCVLAAGQTCALSSATRFVTYTAFDMTSTITQGTTSSAFNYDPEHNRMFRRDVAGGATTNTVYWNDPVANVVNERIQTGSVYTWKNYIKVGGQLIALRTTVDGAGTFDTKYFVTDHLGSVSVVTDGNSGDSNYGQVITGGRLFYDAWGKMRNNDGSADTTCGNPQAAQSATGSDRTFTAQESMPAYCLLNYNARLYDPALGRFLSADPTTEAVYNLQDLNRYSYVLNNPLSLNDPTGYGGLFSHAGIYGVIFDIALVVVLQELALPAIEAQLAGTASLSPVVLGAVNAGISGGIAGGASTGTLKGALIGAAEAGAFSGLPSGGSDLFSAATVESFVSHGVVGGLASWAGGEKFGSGFLAAGISSLADDPGLNTNSFIANTFIHAAAGGFGSILGGGKFANGAVTGAFEYAATSAAAGEQANGDAATVEPAQLVTPVEPDEVRDEDDILEKGPLDSSVEAEARSCPNCAAPILEAPKDYPAWEGTSYSYVLKEDMIVYRVWGNLSRMNGGWFTTTIPLSSEEARNDYALPPDNSAENVTRVTLPAGTRIQIGRAAGIAGWGGGGGMQVHILQSIPNSSFGVTIPLSHYP